MLCRKDHLNKKLKIILETIDHKTRKSDGNKLLDLFKEVTGEEPVMWGSSIVGFGTNRYENTKVMILSGRELGFHREQSLSIYITPGFEGF